MGLEGKGGGGAAGGAGSGAHWEKHVDEDSGATYYYNERTGVSSWEIPEGYKEEDAQAKGEAKPAVWRKFVDDESGATYYYDEANGVSRWEKPKDFVDEEQEQEQEQEASTDKTAGPVEDEERGPQQEEKQPMQVGCKAENQRNEAEKVPDTAVLKPQDSVASTSSTKEGEVAAEPAEAPSSSTGSSKWVKYVDQTSGKPYFHDASTGKTQWEEPESYVDAAPVAGPRVSAEYQAHLNRVRTERLTRVTQQVLDPSGNLGKLNAILSGIDGGVKAGDSSEKLSQKAEWQQHVDAQTQRYYYHNVVTGVTQWSKPDAPVVSGLADWIPPEVPGSEGGGAAQKTVSGVNYVARAKFNRLTGKYEQLDGEDHWQSAGLAPDRAGRQMSHFFDMTDLEKNREEARRRKEQLKRKNIDWKKIAAEKKAKKQKQKNEWLYND